MTKSEGTRQVLLKKFKEDETFVFENDLNLYQAVVANDLERVKELLDRGATIAYKTKIGIY